MVLLGGVSNFDRKELLAPAMLTSMYAMAEGRATGSKAALKEARGGDLGGAAMTALGEDDQALATFLKGLELYQVGAARQSGDAVPELDADGADVRTVAAVSRCGTGGRQSSQGCRGLDPERINDAAECGDRAASPAKNGSRPANRCWRSRHSSSPCNSRTLMRDRKSCWVSRTCLAEEPRCGDGADAVSRRQSNRRRGPARGHLQHLHPPSERAATGFAGDRSRQPGEMAEGLRGDRRDRCSRWSRLGETRSEFEVETRLAN